MIFTTSQKLIIFFTCWKKLAKKIFFCVPGQPPPPELHIRIVKKMIKISCTRVHGFEEISKFHVPGYMDLKKKQNIMYPGTWIWRKNKIPCTGIHESEKNTLMCSSGGGGGPAQFFFIFFANFFQYVKKLINFGNFLKIKVAKFKFNHLG